MTRPRREQCRKCRGAGVVGKKRATCTTCQGSGAVLIGDDGIAPAPPKEAK